MEKLGQKIGGQASKFDGIVERVGPRRTAILQRIVPADPDPLPPGILPLLEGRREAVRSKLDVDLLSLKTELLKEGEALAVAFETDLGVARSRSRATKPSGCSARSGWRHSGRHGMEVNMDFSAAGGWVTAAEVSAIVSMGESVAENAMLMGRITLADGREQRTLEDDLQFLVPALCLRAPRTLAQGGTAEVRLASQPVRYRLDLERETVVFSEREQAVARFPRGPLTRMGRVLTACCTWSRRGSSRTSLRARTLAASLPRLSVAWAWAARQRSRSLV